MNYHIPRLSLYRHMTKKKNSKLQLNVETGEKYSKEDGLYKKTMN